MTEAVAMRATCHTARCKLLVVELVLLVVGVVVGASARVEILALRRVHDVMLAKTQLHNSPL